MKAEINYKIAKELLIGDLRVILFDFKDMPELSSILNRNVICVDKYGELIWQIEELAHYPGNFTKCPYVNIHFIENTLRLINFCTLLVFVDHNSGKILQTKYVR